MTAPQTSRPADAGRNPQTLGSGGKGVPGPEAWGSTDGPGANPTCDWAGCSKPGHRHDGEFWHCAEHWRQHQAFEREEKADQAPQPLHRSDPGYELRVREVRTCAALGMSTREIAEHLGLLFYTVKRLRKVAGMPATPERQAVHGTRGGFWRHRDRHEEPCEPCREAERAYQREHYKRRKQAA